MKIGLYEFNILDENEKAQTIWDNGTFLTNKSDEEKAVNLYALGDFYVEVWYDKPHNRITQIRSFKTVNNLSPYLDDIDLDTLTP